MKFKSVVYILLVFPILTFGQKNIKKFNDETLELGTELYRSELASWQSTDILLPKLKEMGNSFGGYLSYAVGDVTRSIFYDNSSDNKIHYQVDFKNIDKLQNVYTIDSTERIPTKVEKRLMHGRREAAMAVNVNKDSLFSFYENTNYNYIPLIDNKNNLVVYSVTGPSGGEAVIIGNDYKFDFDKKDKLAEVSKIHNGILAHPYKVEDGKVQSVFHNHVIEEYPIITATDLCTLMLYSSYIDWEQYYVISDKFVSIFDFENFNLISLTREAWDKISKQSENKK